MNINEHHYVEKLLQGWEDVYKKSQLTLWIMLALKDGPKHMAQIKQFITNATNDSISADDQSMYRALRRYTDAEMISFEQVPGSSGPDRKVYRLTSIGEQVLEGFVQRNIRQVLYAPKVKELIERNQQ